jgi:pimeloyl-ACP methyl ester carboxylesterase
MAATHFAFLHGGAQGSWVWNKTIAALMERSGGTAATCMALDVPGCGVKRGRDTSSMEFDDIACELNADLDAAGMRDVVLIGHSQAGMMMPRMVEFAPNLVSQLIYVTCSAPPNGMTILELMGNGLHGEQKDRVGWPIDPKNSTLRERSRAMFCGDMPDAQQEEFLAEIEKDMWPLSSYSHRDWRYDLLDAIPSTYVVCLKDMSLPPPWQHRFAQMLRAERTVDIDAGHQLMNTKPGQLAEALLGEVHQ